MNAFKKVAITVVAAIFGFAHFSAQASEGNNMVFTITVNDSSPQASVFVPTKELLRELANSRPAGEKPNFSDNPFLTVDWEIDVSIELDDEELIASTAI